jgi:hypothetical protein
LDFFYFNVCDINVKRFIPNNLSEINISKIGGRKEALQDIIVKLISINLYERMKGKHKSKNKGIQEMTKGKIKNKNKNLTVQEDKS